MHAPLTVEAEGTTAEGPEVALFLCPCPFFVLVSLFLSPFRPRPRYLFACLLPFFQPPFTRHSSFCCPLFILSLSHTPFFLFVYLSVKHASPPPCRGRSYNRERPKGCPPSLPLPIFCSLLPYCEASFTFTLLSFFLFLPLHSSLSCPFIILGKRAS